MDAEILAACSGDATACRGQPGSVFRAEGAGLLQKFLALARKLVHLFFQALRLVAPLFFFA